MKVRITAPKEKALPARPVGASTRISPWRKYGPLAGGLGALLLAGAGEAIVESGSKSILSLVLYLAAVGLFAASALSLPRAIADLPDVTPEEARPTSRRLHVWLIVGGGTGLSLLLALVAIAMISSRLTSVVGSWLWLLSMAVLLSTGIAVARLEGWSARWGISVWPSDPRWRWALVVVLSAVMLLAVAARLLWLDQVPLGINADEGDRGALAIQVVRGDNTQSIFDNGWYWISMLYFWLLAQVMKVAGISWVGARAFGALASVLSVAIVTWMGIRNFGLRVGLMAGAILSVLAVSLQFARETSEAGPTATLWAASAALFLEGARRGRLWAWIGAGLAGGLSIYFYPSGRLWVLLAVMWGIYLLVHGLGGHRRGIVVGLALSAFASLVAVAPFLVHSVQLSPDILRSPMLVERAQETSIFVPANLTRLHYYQPGMSFPELLGQQLVYSIGAFNQFHGGGDFWPTDKPLMSGLLAVLTLLGLGWCCVRVRDPRFVILAIWFWVGFLGVILTVETPNVERMATAVPVLAFFPALVLDSLANRASPLMRQIRLPRRTQVGWAIGGALALVVAFLMVQQWQFYFDFYGKTDRWPQPTNLGLAVREQGADTLVTTVGQQYHMVNSGWVRLLAPDTPRGGVASPGSLLPLPLPADRNLTFLLFPKQATYLPLLREIYPGGEVKPYMHRTEGLMFTTYHIAQAQWAAVQGTMVTPPDGSSVRVDALGQAPSNWTSFPASMRWTAGLRVPQFWNYDFRIGPGPAKLTIDGDALLTVPAGISSLTTTVSLAQGYHYVSYSGTLTSAGKPALFEWRAAPIEGEEPAVLPDWQSPGAGSLSGTMSGPTGLYGVVQGTNHVPDLHRIDGTLATCCLTDEVRFSPATPYTATWTSTLLAPATGVYSMTLFAQGAIDLSLDGTLAFHSDKASDQPHGFTANLTKGPHPLRIVFRVETGPGGIEWTWTPPNGETSIVPPSALTPPNSGVGPPLSETVLGRPNQQNTDKPLEVVK